jgi:hypothetical protein
MPMDSHKRSNSSDAVVVAVVTKLITDENSEFRLGGGEILVPLIILSVCVDLEFLLYVLSSAGIMGLKKSIPMVSPGGNQIHAL